MLRAIDNPDLLKLGTLILASNHPDKWDAHIKRFFAEGHLHVGHGWLKWTATWTTDLGDMMAALLKDREEKPQLGTRNIHKLNKTFIS